MISDLADHERPLKQSPFKFTGSYYPEAEAEIAARVPPRHQAGPIRGLLEHRIVYQGRVQELGCFIVGEGVAIEVVGRIELPRKQVEAVLKQTESQPGFPYRQPL